MLYLGGIAPERAAMPTPNPTRSAAIAQFNALMAGIEALSADSRGPALREYLERSLDRLETIERVYYEYLAECAQLAAANVQDVRLFDLEQRVDAVEHPDSTLGEFLFGVAMNIAIQFGILLVLEGAVTSVLTAASGRVSAGAARDVAARFGPRSANAITLSTLDRATNDLNVATASADALPVIFERLQRGDPVPSGGYRLEVRAGGRETLRINDIPSWVKASETVALRRSAFSDELQLTRRALDQKNIKALPAYDRGMADANAAGAASFQSNYGKWHEFLGDERGGLILTPLYSIVDGAREGLLEVTAPARTTPALTLTSSIAGRFLDWCQQRRVEVAESYSALKLEVRYSTESEFQASERAALLIEMVVTVLPAFEHQRGLLAAARGAVVSGFEAAFWSELLRANGYLEVKFGKNYMTSSPLQKGEFEAGYITTSEGDAVDDLGGSATVPQQLFKADYFPGVTMLTETQALYLYQRYAKPFFADPANVARAELPFPYDPATFEKPVTDPPTFWNKLLPNWSRDARLDQMRLLVILYFIELSGLRTDPQLAKVLGEGIGAGIDDYIKGMPTGTLPDPPDAAEATFDALEQSTPPLQALFGAIGATPQTEVDRDVQRFAAELAALEQDIENYELAADRFEIGLTGTGLFASPSDLLDSIHDRQGDLGATYQILKQRAQEVPDTLEWIERFLDPRADAALGWIESADPAQRPTPWQITVPADPN